MKREEIGSMIRRGLIPWIEPLPEPKQCMVVVTVAGPGRNCANPSHWSFTADPRSLFSGAVYCWTHLLMIASSGDEQARLEAHLREVSGV